MKGVKKYKNVFVNCKNHGRIDSLLEYNVLKVIESFCKDNNIEFKRQVKFELLPKSDLRKRGIYIKPDFQIGDHIIEVKSTATITPTFKLKLELFKSKYKGLKFHIVKSVSDIYKLLKEIKEELVI